MIAVTALYENRHTKLSPDVSSNSTALQIAPEHYVRNLTDLIISMKSSGSSRVI